MFLSEPVYLQVDWNRDGAFVAKGTLTGYQAPAAVHPMRSRSRSCQMAAAAVYFPVTPSIE
jgi:hypothetical protein